MKIVITEKQLKKLQESDDDLQKTNELVFSMYDDGMDINDIQKYTNLPKRALIFLLKDRVKVDVNDINTANKLAIKLKEDIDFYNHCSEFAKKIVEDYYDENKWLNKINKSLEGFLTL